MSTSQENRIKAILQEFDLEVESRCSELESVNERLKQGMRTEFRVQLMKLPLSVRKMSVAEFCHVYHADINGVINAEEIKAKTKIVGPPTSLSAAVQTPGTKRGRPKADASEGFSAATLQALQGKGLDDQLRMIQQIQSQLDAYASQIKHAQSAN